MDVPSTLVRVWKRRLQHVDTVENNVDDDKSIQSYVVYSGNVASCHHHHHRRGGLLATSSTNGSDEIGDDTSRNATATATGTSQEHHQSQNPLPRFVTERHRRRTTTIFYHENEVVGDDGDGGGDGSLGRQTDDGLPKTSRTAIDTRTEPTDGTVPESSGDELVSFVCGLTAGVIQAGLFNPFDRALYLSVTQHRPFLCWENFNNPYMGFLQSVGHRALSGGLYFPLENLFCRLLLKPSPSAVRDDNNNNDDDDHDRNESHGTFFQNHPAFANFVAGTLAGTSQAFICNPISALKYKSWSRETNRGIVVEASEMFRKGGLRPFCNGLIPTVWRDLVFGGTYTFLRLEIQYRLQLRQEQQWAANMVAASLATVVSGPFNLARNVQYATRSRKVADGVVPILKDLIHETIERETLLQKYKYLQSRLRIGWGTIRVAVGMSFGQVLYDKLMGLYHSEERGDF